MPLFLLMSLLEISATLWLFTMSSTVWDFLIDGLTGLRSVSSPTFSVMLNGSPHGFFKSNRGMRQEDPLPPCFFVLVMKFWSITMDIAIASGDISPLRKNGKMLVSHLLFADDMLVYCKGDRRSGNDLNFALQILEWYIGLVINRRKKQGFFQ